MEDVTAFLTAAGTASDAEPLLPADNVAETTLLVRLLDAGCRPLSSSRGVSAARLVPAGRIHTRELIILNEMKSPTTPVKKMDFEVPC